MARIAISTTCDIYMGRRRPRGRVHRPERRREAVFARSVARPSQRAARRRSRCLARGGLHECICVYVVPFATFIIAKMHMHM